MDLKFLDRIRDIAQLMRNPPEDPELAMFTTFVMLRDLANSSEIQALSTKPGKAKEFEAKVVGISKKGLLTNIIYLPKELIAEMGRVFLRNPDMYKMDKSGKFGIEGLVQVSDRLLKLFSIMVFISLIIVTFSLLNLRCSNIISICICNSRIFSNRRRRRRR